MDQSEANIGYALLDESGTIVAADEVFRGWLGGRGLAELLPDFNPTSPPSIRARSKLCPAGFEPTLADIELRRLESKASTSLLLCVEIAANTAREFEYCDVVTGLPDRRALAAHRATLLRDANGKLPHAVLFLDLDNFKEINDSLGHAMGDQVLAVLAERWRKSLRGPDLIVRYGGDEFVVLLGGIRSRAEVQPIVDRLQSVTVAPIEIDGHRLQVSVAIGIALAADATTPLSELLQSADKAMYADKSQSS